MAIIIQQRRDTAANFTETNPLLAQGELAYELDTGYEKRGDGTTLWNDLPYKDTSHSTKVTFTATEGQTVFVLPEKPASIDLVMNRTHLMEDIDYTYAPATGTITLTTGAPAGSKLSARQFK